MLNVTPYVANSKILAMLHRFFFVLATVVLKRFHACVSIQTCAKAKYGVWYTSNGTNSCQNDELNTTTCVIVYQMP